MVLFNNLKIYNMKKRLKNVARQNKQHENILTL